MRQALLEYIKRAVLLVLLVYSVFSSTALEVVLWSTDRRQPGDTPHDPRINKHAYAQTRQASYS